MTEWREIEGYLGYEVSDDGRVRSWKVQRSKHRVATKPRELSAWLSVGGYLTVGLCGVNGNRLFFVHRLVLSTFHGPCPDGMEGCHNDGHKRNNHANNLRWATRADNVLDKMKHGHTPRGERGGLAKLTWPQVRAIRSSSETQQVLADRHDVCQRTVCAVMRYETWKYDPEDASRSDAEVA